MTPTAASPAAGTLLEMAPCTMGTVREAAASRYAQKPESGLDQRSAAVKKLTADDKITPAEAKDVVALAAKDAKLGPKATKDETEAAVTNLYVRSGVSLDEAESAARRTVALAAKPGAASDSFEIKTARPEPGRTDSSALRSDAEKSVANNKAKDKPWSAAEIDKDRAGFVRNLSQIDGDAKTTSDQTACVATSYVGGVILADPKKAQDLAGKLLTDKGQSEFPSAAKPEVKSALERMKSGAYSAKDASLVSNALSDSMQYTDRDGDKTAGLPTARAMAMNAKLQGIGFAPPKMRIDVYGSNDGTNNGVHATAFSNNTGFDPWPYRGNHGQASVTDGEKAHDAHGRTLWQRVGSNHPLLQNRDRLESMEFDGAGGVKLTKHYDLDQKLTPPVAVRYGYDATKGEYTRKSPVASEYEAYFPERFDRDPQKMQDSFSDSPPVLKYSDDFKSKEVWMPPTYIYA